MMFVDDLGMQCVDRRITRDQIHVADETFFYEDWRTHV